MTYHYLTLAHYLKFGALELVPLSRSGQDITPKTEQEEVLLWSAKVIDYYIDDNKTMFATLNRD